ncbi:hypothetical protein [Nitrospira sp. Nam80]
MADQAHNAYAIEEFIVQIQTYTLEGKNDERAKQLIDNFSSVLTPLFTFAKSKNLPAEFIENHKYQITREIYRKIRSGKLHYEGLDHFGALRARGIEYVVVSQITVQPGMEQTSKILIKSRIVRLDADHLNSVNTIEHSLLPNTSYKLFYAGWANKLVNALLSDKGIPKPQGNSVLVLGSTFFPDSVITCAWSRTTASYLQAEIRLLLSKILFDGELNRFKPEVHPNSGDPLTASMVQTLKEDDADAAVYVHSEIRVRDLHDNGSCIDTPEKIHIIFLFVIEGRNNFKEVAGEESKLLSLSSTLESVLKTLKSKIAGKDFTQAEL